MADFSIQEAAFTGFRVVRDHARFLAIWATLALIVSIILTAAFVVFAGPDLMRLQQSAASGYRNLPLVTAVFQKLLPAYALAAPAALAFYGVLFAAMNRAVLTPNDHKFAYFAATGDELRQIGLLMLTLAVSLGTYIAMGIIAVVIGVVLDVTVHVKPAVVGILAILAIGGVFSFLSVRFSLAPAITFRTRRIDLFGSWALTRGRFWPIAGTYLLTLALTGVVLMLTYLMTLAITAVITGNMFSAMAPLNLSSLEAFFTAPNLVQMILNACVSALVWPVMLTPPAAIYLALALADAVPETRAIT